MSFTHSMVCWIMSRKQLLAVNLQKMKVLRRRKCTNSKESTHIFGKMYQKQHTTKVFPYKSLI